jgi:hypothetical protein
LTKNALGSFAAKRPFNLSLTSQRVKIENLEKKKLNFAKKRELAVWQWIWVWVCWILPNSAFFNITEGFTEKV